MSFGAPEVLLFLQLALYLAVTLPVFVAAKTLGTSQSGWAFLPVGNLVVLVRTARFHWANVFWFAVPLVNLLMWAVCWVAVSRGGGRPGWMGWLCVLPVVNLVVPFVIAAVLRPPTSDVVSERTRELMADPGLESLPPASPTPAFAASVAGDDLWSRRPDGVWMRWNPSSARWEGSERARGGIGFPAFMAASAALVIACGALVAGLLWLDHDYWQVVVNDDAAVVADIRELERNQRRIESVAARPSNQQAPNATSGQIERLAAISAFSWMQHLVNNGRITQASATANMAACRDGILNGGSEFEAACQ